MNRLIKTIFIIAISIGVGQDGAKLVINDIHFSGVENIDVKEVRDVLRIHEARFLSKMDFDRRLIKLDAINIKTLYVSEGYLGVNVKDSVAYSNEFVDVYFIVDEGKRYYINDISIVGNKVITDNDIKGILGLQTDKPYNPVRTNVQINELEDEYRRIGKLFADIKISDTIIDSVDISINISEGPDVYINNIYYNGVGRIDTNVVRREMQIQSGDIYDQHKINQSQRELLQTGIYSVANIIPLKVAQNDTLVNLLVELRPFKQYEWISEGGYYPIEYYEGAEAEPGAGVLVEWRNRSLFDSATSLSTKLSGQTLFTENSFNPKIRFDISLSNPWLYKVKIPTKAQIYLESFRDYISIGSPYVTRYGIELLNTYYIDRIERRSYIESRLYLDRFSRRDYLENGIAVLRSSSDGRKIQVEKHSFEINFRLDKSDNVLYPKKGLVYSGQFNRTGGILGGNRDFYKIDLGIKGYVPIFENIIFASQIRYGMIIGWNAEYHDYLYDQFYLGGSNTLRGWDMLRYRVDANDQPSGDIIRILNNYEIRFPLFWLLGGELFLDGGHICGDYKNIALKDLNWNAGFGLTLSTPLGPIRLDAAKALNEDLNWKIQLGVQYIF